MQMEILGVYDLKCFVAKELCIPVAWVSNNMDPESRPVEKNT